LVLFTDVPGRFQKHYTTLIQHMDSEFGLLDELQSNDVLSARHVEDVNAEPTASKKNETIVTCLRRTSDKDYERFLESLDKTSQTHVARCLREG